FRLQGKIFFHIYFKGIITDHFQDNGNGLVTEFLKLFVLKKIAFHFFKNTVAMFCYMRGKKIDHPVILRKQRTQFLTSLCLAHVPLPPPYLLRTSHKNRLPLPASENSLLRRWCSFSFPHKILLLQ